MPDTKDLAQRIEAAQDALELHPPSLDEVREKADAIIGMKLVSKQTGTEGRLVKKVLVAR